MWSCDVKDVLRPDPHACRLLRTWKANKTQEWVWKYSASTIWNRKNNNQWTPLEFHWETLDLFETGIWVLAVLARNLPACWLGVYQPAAELARNLPTCSSIGSEFTNLRPQDFGRKYQIGGRTNQEPSTPEIQSIAQPRIKKRGSSCTCLNHDARRKN
jgi:hypothetical protein